MLSTDVFLVWNWITLRWYLKLSHNYHTHTHIFRIVAIAHTRLRVNTQFRHRGHLSALLRRQRWLPPQMLLPVSWLWRFSTADAIPSVWGIALGRALGRIQLSGRFPRFTHSVLLVHLPVSDISKRNQWWPGTLYLVFMHILLQKEALIK